MASTSANLTIDQGANYQCTVTVYNGSTSSILNLTGYTVRSQLRDSFASTSKTDFTAALVSATAGTLRISLTSTQTAALLAKDYKYDIEIVSGGGVVTRVLKGTATVDPEVTR